MWLLLLLPPTGRLALLVALLARAKAIGIAVTAAELKLVALLAVVVKVPLGEVQRTGAASWGARTYK